MNNALTTLANAYLDNGTGSVILYYDFLENGTGVVGAGSAFTGAILNASPASTVGDYPGLVLNATGSTPSAAAASLADFIQDENSGGDISFSNVRFGGFSKDGFLNQTDFESEFTILFSFEKNDGANGVLIGSLVEEDYDDGNIQFSYGRGFNVGVNDRNKLFFQGVDANLGPYILTAENLELAKKNICSVRVSPYEVSFAYYNLANDSFEEQYLRTDVKLENPASGEYFYLGGSPTYIKEGPSFNGFVDELLFVSGAVLSSDLKSVASGFVATGSPITGSSFQDVVITGHQIEFFPKTGATGFQPVITGYTSVTTETNLIEFVLVPVLTGFIREGERFITGYDLPNNSGSYLEGSSVLVKDNLYRPTGNDAFATLGLKDFQQEVIQYEVVSNKLVSTQTGLPLYGFVPITGILQEPSGFNKVFLTEARTVTGDLPGTLVFKEGIAQTYQHDYIYYLGQR